MKLNNEINYFGNIIQTHVGSNIKNLAQIYNMKLKDNQYSIQFKQLIAYFNFRRKVNQYLLNEITNIKTNVYDQNNYCLIDKNWLEKWKKHVGYNEIKKTYYLKKLNRDINESDYNWINPIIEKNIKDNFLELLDNKNIYKKNSFKIDPLADFNMIDKKCYEYFTFGNNKQIFNEQTLINKPLPTIFSKGKLRIMFDVLNYQIVFIDKNTNKYLELLIIFLEDKPGRKQTLDDIDKNNMNDWLKNLNFNLYKDENREYNLLNCKFKIIKIIRIKYK